VLRPEPQTPFEAYVLEKLEKLEKIDGFENRFDRIEVKLEQVIKKQEIHDAKFEAIFYCFDRHGERLDRIEKLLVNQRARINHLEFRAGVI